MLVLSTGSWKIHRISRPNILSNRKTIKSFIVLSLLILLFVFYKLQSLISDRQICAKSRSRYKSVCGKFSLILLHQRTSAVVTLSLLPAATKLGQGNKFTGVSLSTGGVSEIFGGCLKFWGGLKFWGVWNFLGGWNFQGGVWNFRGVSNFSGGLQIFFFFFFNFFSPQKNSSGMHQAPPPPRRSMRGRYASYWNAFLLKDYECSLLMEYCTRQLSSEWPKTYRAAAYRILKHSLKESFRYLSH